MSFLKLSASHPSQFIDRYGKIHTLPQGTRPTYRLGIFGITISTGGNLLVTCPPAAPDKPGLPGGGREGIETHAQALQREYFEELGPYFVIMGNSKMVYHQKLFYYAFDRDEYWHYQQYFYIVNTHHPKLATSWWTTPEGGRAAWIPLRDYRRITVSHQSGILRYMSYLKGTRLQFR